jgi:hypothetical protein
MPEPATPLVWHIGNNARASNTTWVTRL